MRPPSSRRRRSFRVLSPLRVLVVGGFVAPLLVIAGGASAQDTTTSVPTTIGGDPATALAPESSTVPAAGLPIDPALPTTSMPPGADEVEGSYSAQTPFDVASLSPDPLLVAAARQTLDQLTIGLTAADGRLAAAEAALAELSARNGDLDARTQQLVDEAAIAERQFRSRAAAAYVRGDTRDFQLTVVLDPSKWSVIHRYLGAIHDADQRGVDQIRAIRAGLDGETARLAAELASAQGRLSELRSERDAAAQRVNEQAVALAAFEARSRIFVVGFVFPVTGPVTFDDSWGYARMPGTPSAHWHEGTDIMAPTGTPVVACETGYIDRIDTNQLGGQSLWITGASGARYYYAHLSAYAEGLVVGQTVTAGQVVGAVGTTGNAAGGAAHLHFEVHPDGGAPVDPYPMLSVVYVPPVADADPSAPSGTQPASG